MAKGKAPMNPGDIGGLAKKDWLPSYSDFGPPARPKPRPNPDKYFSSRERSRGEPQVVGARPVRIDPDAYFSSAERGGKRGR